jgi:hypothetical protein
MIKIEITHSPYPEQIGMVTFHKNEIYIGKTYGDILIINDLMINNFLFIEIIEDQQVLFCHPHPDVSHFHVNNKRCETPRKITNGDTIGIHQVVIKIIDFNFVSKKTFKDHLNHHLDQLLTSKSPIVEIVRQLEEENDTNE